MGHDSLNIGLQLAYKRPLAILRTVCERLPTGLRARSGADFPWKAEPLPWRPFGSPQVPLRIPQETRLPRPAAGKRTRFPQSLRLRGDQHQVFFFSKEEKKALSGVRSGELAPHPAGLPKNRPHGRFSAKLQMQWHTSWGIGSGNKGIGQGIGGHSSENWCMRSREPEQIDLVVLDRDPTGAWLPCCL